MSKIRSALFGALACAASFNSLATDFTVEVLNLTRGSSFTPILVTAHPEANRLFTSGTTASSSLQTMAEQNLLFLIKSVG